ncbi:hypothetical protein DPMN_000721 [Dreissena polymorpha]|uniref:Uncharacterized protein n=1 Tax=Dreissena polymorpha TaxID=45954 RepID=A0A9D4RSA3_DREPO|nr:hypothetical protein DPMN_000721 [Dreissena polymorpha]
MSHSGWSGAYLQQSPVLMYEPLRVVGCLLHERLGRQAGHRAVGLQGAQLHLLHLCVTAHTQQLLVGTIKQGPGNPRLLLSLLFLLSGYK